MQYPLPRQFRVTFEDLRVVASGLNRPECVLALSDGMLLAAHLGVILALFLVLPYSKFVHGIYRSAALLRNAAERGAR